MACKTPSDPPFFKKDFIYFRERTSKHTQGEGQREKQSPHRAGSLLWGSIPGP